MRSESSLRTSLNNKKILILGSGYLGSKIYDHLTDVFIGEEPNVYLVKAGNGSLNYHDKKTLWKMLLRFEPDVVINCSGFTGRPNIDEAELKKEECWKYNVQSPLQVAELCHQKGVKHIHVSSGCIYTGYDKEFTEEDRPNFGLFDVSSTYSKTKHAYEFLSEQYPSKTLRIRMPISGGAERCYLSKIKNYDKLIDFVNSKTYIPDLCGFIEELITNPDIEWKTNDIYNIVNPEPLTTSKVCEIMFMAKDHNPNWEFVSIDRIPILAPRSNCVLDSSKADSIYPLRTELEALVDLYGLEDLQLTRDLLS